VERRTASVIAALLLMSGCDRVEITTVEAASVQVSPATATIAPTGTIRLSATVLSSDGRSLSGRAIAWHSAEPSIATVAADGTVTGVAPGVALIEATSDGVAGTATVRVTAGPVIGATPTAIEFTGVRGGASPGDRTISISNAGGGDLSGLSVAIRYAAGQPGGWLSATLAAGSAPTTIVLSADQGSLPVGTYTATVDVSATSADADASIVVTLRVVEPQPAIALGASSVSFAASRGGADPSARTVAITNAGGGTLDGLSVEVRYTDGQPTGWLAATLDATVAPTTLTLAATTGTLEPGTYTASARISSAAAQNSPQAVAVTFTIGEGQPLIDLDPATLLFTATAGSGSVQTKDVSITNAGADTLEDLTIAVTFPGGQPVGWLTTSLSSTTAPAVLSVRVSAAGLPAGTYTATVQVAAAAAANSPQSVTITFEVSEPPPAIALSASTASFSITGSGTVSAPVEISITNSGGGTLGGLNYSIGYGAGQPTGWLDASLAGSTAPTVLTLSVTDTGLQPGSYSAAVTITSPDAANTGQVNVSLSVSQNPPSPPTGLTAVAVSDRRIDVAWTDASDDESSFLLERSADGGQTWTGIATPAAGVTSFTDETGLVGSTEYTYRVSACNAAGCALADETAAATTAPEAPSGLSVTRHASGRHDLTWSDHSPDETAFQLERSIDGGTVWAVIHTASANTTSYSDEDVTSGITYQYRINACRDDVCSRYSNVAEIGPPEPEVPGAPSGLSATAVSSSQIDLAWAAGTGEIAEYRIDRKTGDEAFSEIAVVGGTTLEFADGGLDADTRYVYQVRACNGVGCSAPSDSAAATTWPDVPPAVPTAVAAEGVSSSAIDVTWAHDGLLLVSSFDVQRAPEPGAASEPADDDFTTVHTTADGTARSYTDTGLAGATTYFYRVRACNVTGCSEWSDAASGTTQAEGAPALPTDVTAVATSPTTITLSWVPPGGQTSYELRRRSGRGGPWTFSTTAPADAVEYNDSGLEPGSTYQYDLRACSGANCTDDWARAEATTPDSDEPVPGADYLAGTRTNEYSSLMSSATESTDATRGFCMSNCSKVNAVLASPRRVPFATVAVTSHVTGRVTPRRVRSPTS
jgi:hypothetical protein